MARILDPAARRRAGMAVGVAVVAALLAGCAGSGQSEPGEFGSFTLKPGETRQIQTGYIYRNMRVCNDAGSAGPITAAIDDHVPHELQAGVCAEDLGNGVLLHNQSSGEARGTYRPIYDFQFQGH